MDLEGFLNQYKDAKEAKKTATEKLRAAMEELNAAENQLDNVLGILSDNAEGFVSEGADFSFDEIFGPARIMDKLFGGTFGDLF